LAESIQQDAVQPRKILDEVRAAEDHIGPAAEESQPPAHVALVRVLLAHRDVAVSVPRPPRARRRRDACVASVGIHHDALAGRA
jgi:hypothetical protein